MAKVVNIVVIPVIVIQFRVFPKPNHGNDQWGMELIERFTVMILTQGEMDAN